MTFNGANVSGFGYQDGSFQKRITIWRFGEPENACSIEDVQWKIP